MSSFNYGIEYVKGEKNQIADYLSRMGQLEISEKGVPGINVNSNHANTLDATDIKKRYTESMRMHVGDIQG
jgi:hypothetical protein